MLFLCLTDRVKTKIQNRIRNPNYIKAMNQPTVQPQLVSTSEPKAMRTLDLWMWMMMRITQVLCSGFYNHKIFYQDPFELKKNACAPFWTSMLALVHEAIHLLPASPKITCSKSLFEKFSGLIRIAFLSFKLFSYVLVAPTCCSVNLADYFRVVWADFAD